MNNRKCTVCGNDLPDVWLSVLPPCSHVNYAAVTTNTIDFSSISSDLYGYFEKTGLQNLSASLIETK